MVMHVVEPEDEVVRRERLAVRPLHALAEVQREIHAVRAGVPILDDVRARRRTGVVPIEDVVGAGATAVAVPLVGGSAESSAPDAAVLPYFVYGFDDQRVFADSLGNGGQLAGGYEVRELRSFVE